MLAIRIPMVCCFAAALLALGCGAKPDTAPVAAADTAQDAAGNGFDGLATTADASATDVGSAEVSTPGDADAGPAAKPPTVRASAAYDVVTKTDIVYAKALVDAKWGAVAGKEIDLQLDSFAPKAPLPGLMPALVLIHGGGFTGGSRKDGNMVAQAKYLAARGWYVVSITYRLAGTQGPIPAKWLSAAKASGSENVASAMYLAGRDAKAAVRWLHHNAAALGVDPNHIAIGGGSAGAYTAIGVGLSQPAELRDELTLQQDPTLASTHLAATSGVRAVIDYWGSGSMLDLLLLVTGTVAFDPTDPPMAILHGTEDETVSFAEAKNLKKRYDETGVAYIYHPLQGEGHGAWTAKIGGKSLVETAFDFLVKQQGLSVQP